MMELMGAPARQSDGEPVSYGHIREEVNLVGNSIWVAARTGVF